jgi:[CysO sulfur-carrier protein]-S-L-cysteine hydrolase
VEPQHPASRAGAGTPSEVRLPRTLVNQLLHAAQSSPETEVCGLIGLGQEGTTLYPVRNAARDPAHRFELDGSEQIAAMRTMRERGENLFAIYHSHPHTPAWPSARDVKEASYAEALYLIVSLDTRGVLEMRGFRLADSTVTEVPLVL